MRTYTVVKITGAPNWENVPVMPIDNLLWTDSIDVTAQAQLCYDGDNLYVRLEAVEPHIRMEETDPMSEPCLDSCLEFFVRPTERMDYFNIEMNPNKLLFLGFGSGVHDLIRLMPLDTKALLAPQVEFTEGGWVLSYRLPFAFVRQFFPEFEAKAGAKMYANAYKCGDLSVKRHYLAWNPVLCDSPAFHRPQDFGCLILGE